MNDIVSRNTIQLAGSASGVDNFYTGYTIVLKRFNAITGKELIQKKRIIAYTGSNKIATIDGIWDIDFIPRPTDTYEIIPTYGDVRVSTNPAIQTLDYVTSKRYGKGLNPDQDLRMTTWLESARSCDIQSDVTIEVQNGFTVPLVGSVYRYPQSGPLYFQGEVKKVSGNYVTFTKVIGKYTNKWNSWKSYRVDELVYNEGRLYRVEIAGPKINPPTHSSGSFGGLAYQPDPALYRLSGYSGIPTFAAIKNVGNPVRARNAKGTLISGYSLYDADGVDYWRYLGWDEHSQRYATRHQTNLIIDTSVSLFDNTNSLLEHFNGIMRYTAGKYELEVEQGEEPFTSTDVRTISDDDIIGRIRLSDDGIRTSFNSLAVAYADPANKFEARNISFFNSDYLKADRNVPKKGNVAIPGITNYYNARILADKFLAKSRYGLAINFNMAPKGSLLLAGKVIQVNSPRYGWNNKRFRIENITHNVDTTVDIVAKEYDDEFYVISNISKTPASGMAGDPSTATSVQPGGLVASGIASENEKIGGIELSWDPLETPDPTVVTEIYGGRSSNLFTTITGHSTGSVNSVHVDLVDGQQITAWESIGNIDKGQIYTYVLKDGMQRAEIHLKGKKVNVLAENYRFCTAVVIDTVDSNVTSYIDVVNFEDQPFEQIVDPIEEPPVEEPPVEEPPVEEPPVPRVDRIEKFYWIRYKIIQS